MVKNKINKDNLLNVIDDVYEEIIKYLVRVVGERNKVFVDDYYINKLLYLLNNNVRIVGKKNIDK